ncbi:MAG TPA: hypothetical protein VMG99_06530 [Thermoplasmata archaeon]|nr:hypothetical protein [Thermoplasmata archaeon]
MSATAPKAPGTTDFGADDATEVPAPGWRLRGAEREAAIRAPGPSWHDWLYGQAFKWWLGIGLLILDSWLVAGWLEVGNWIAATISIVLAVYVEYLLYQYLWHPYEHGRRGPFRPSWRAPFVVGRWQPEWREIRAGITPDGSVTTDRREFL